MQKILDETVFRFERSDIYMDGDSIITILDVIQVIQSILNS